MSDEWGMKGYDERGMMMVVVRLKKASWHIMKG
jgi:hypothetical protein